MGGTKAGGAKAAATNKALYGEDFYSRIGRKGGKLGHTGGFHANRELARTAGAKGGSISRRGKAKLNKPVEIKKVEEDTNETREHVNKTIEKRSLITKIFGKRK